MQDMYTPRTGLDVVWSDISFKSHPVLLGCIVLSVVPGTEKHPNAL